MKVILNDFQILEGKHEFEFPVGINVIVGPNASGKSSLFYAIENCLMNPNGVSDCINYNHNKTSVTIEENNESITWIRTPDSCCYENNKTGQTFVKASKLDSRDIANLNFYFDNKGKVVNIHNEWSVLFPFAESDSDMFRLFEDIFNISCSFLIIDEMKKDEQAAKSSIVKYQEDKIKYEDKLACLNQITDKVKVEDIDCLSASINELLQQTSDLKNSYEMYNKYSFLRNVTVPSSFDVFTLYSASDELNNIQADYNSYIKSLGVASIKVPQVKINLNIEETNELKDDYEKYCVLKASIEDYNNQLKDLITKQNEINEKISTIKVCPTCGRVLED